MPVEATSMPTSMQRTVLRTERFRVLPTPTSIRQTRTASGRSSPRHGIASRSTSQTSIWRETTWVKIVKVCRAVSGPLDRSKRFTLRHQFDFSGKHSSSHAAITREVYSLTFPPLSIARYSFIQLRERKCPNFETVAKGIRTWAHLPTYRWQFSIGHVSSVIDVSWKYLIFFILLLVVYFCSGLQLFVCSSKVLFGKLCYEP